MHFLNAPFDTPFNTPCQNSRFSLPSQIHTLPCPPPLKYTLYRFLLSIQGVTVDSIIPFIATSSTTSNNTHNNHSISISDNTITTDTAAFPPLPAFHIREIYVLREPVSRAVSVYYFWGELFKLHRMGQSLYLTHSSPLTPVYHFTHSPFLYFYPYFIFTHVLFLPICYFSLTEQQRNSSCIPSHHLNANCNLVSPNQTMFYMYPTPDYPDKQPEGELNQTRRERRRHKEPGLKGDPPHATHG